MLVFPLISRLVEEDVSNVAFVDDGAGVELLALVAALELVAAEVVGATVLELVAPVVVL